MLLRRWYIAVPAFLLSVGLAGMVYSSVPKLYVSTSVLLLTTPTSGPSLPRDPGTSNAPTNPLLNFSSGLNTSASILIQALSTPETAEAVGARPGGELTYRVTNGTTNPELLTNGPFVFIEGQAGSPEAAQTIVVRVTERARLELAKRQQTLDAPPATYITLTEVMPPTTPQPQGGDRKRAAAAAGVLGVLASLTAVYGMESISNTRRRRQSVKSGAEPPKPDRGGAKQLALRR